MINLMGKIIYLPVFGTEEWEEAEKEVDAYLACGEFEEFDTMEEFLETLESGEE